jgi:hypothetical protein
MSVRLTYIDARIGRGDVAMSCGFRILRAFSDVIRSRIRNQTLNYVVTHMEMLRDPFKNKKNDVCDSCFQCSE